MRNLSAGLLAAALAVIAMQHAARAQPDATSQARSSQDTCLQSNRIWSWNAANDRLLIVTDRTYRRFIVRLGGGCIGLSSYPLTALQFRTWTNLGCLQRGDNVVFNAPALGPLNCFVDDVQPYSPALLAQEEETRQ